MPLFSAVKSKLRSRLEALVGNAVDFLQIRVGRFDSGSRLH